MIARRVALSQIVLEERHDLVVTLRQRRCTVQELTIDLRRPSNGGHAGRECRNGERGKARAVGDVQHDTRVAQRLARLAARTKPHVESARANPLGDLRTRDRFDVRAVALGESNEIWRHVEKRLHDAREIHDERGAVDRRTHERHRRMDDDDLRSIDARARATPRDWRCARRRRAGRRAPRPGAAG